MSFRPNLPARPADEDVAEVRSGDDGTLVLPAAPPGVDVVSPCPPESRQKSLLLVIFVSGPCLDT